MSEPPLALEQSQALPNYAKLTSELRSSIVRIEKVETLVNWFEPYGEKPETSAVGTGFAAQLVTEKQKIPPNFDKDPIFITNAHVVRNAMRVNIMFPAIGQEDFPGYVPVIYEDHDLAVVKLIDPTPFLKYLEEKSFKLRPLPIRKHFQAMGSTVAAIGFPLGSTTLKLSTGVIAGTELVERMTVFQCTAPISPGNSGGPLIELGDLVTGEVNTDFVVVGVNFAAMETQGAENVNYVIPAVHIRQVLRKFWALETGKAAEPPVNPLMMMMGGGQEMMQQKPPDHETLKLAPIGALPVHTNAALYKLGGCQSGVFLSKVSEPSALQRAKPKIQAMSFVMAVDGVSIDGFGMGRMEKGFLGDPMPFESIMQCQENVEDPVNVTTCKNGTITNHTVSMLSSPDYEPGIRAVTEPSHDLTAMDYEVFADVTVMQMTLNHVWSLMQQGVPPTYGRWLLEDNIIQPRVLITKVVAGSYAASVLAPGMVIASLNGVNISTLQDFRQHFEPSDGLWRLVTERDAFYAVDFVEALATQLQEWQSGAGYLMTPALQAIAQQHGLLQNPEQQQSTMRLAGYLSQMLADAYDQGVATIVQGLRESPALQKFNRTNTSDPFLQQLFGVGAGAGVGNESSALEQGSATARKAMAARVGSARPVTSKSSVLQRSRGLAQLM